MPQTKVAQKMTQKKLEQKMSVYLGVVLVLFVLLVMRLGMLQILQTEAFQTQSKENSIKLLPLAAMRGKILDRNGEVLATSKPVFNLTLVYKGGKEDQSEVIQRLTQVLGDPKITPETVHAQIKAKQFRLYEPIVIKADLNDEEKARIEEHRHELPGVEIVEGPMREYPSGALAGHTLGYVREISAEELKEKKEEGYRQGDLIGKIGLEKAFEQYLRGVDGFQQVEVNVNNRPINYFYTKEPVPGNNLILTLDANLQRAMENSMDETMANVQKKFPKAKAGAAALIDVRTGAVLAILSRPNLNPNDFIGVMSQDTYNFYFTQKADQPAAAINRAIAGAYPPGSTFKPITAMAALTAGMKPEERVTCAGRYWLSPFIKCWQVHGVVDLYRAMAVSCNTYFQEAGRRAGAELLFRVGREFGLGQKTGILPGETSGLLPGPEWKVQWGTSYTKPYYERKLAELDQGYQARIDQAPTPEEKEKLEKQWKKEKASLEAEYNIKLKFNTTWQPYETYNQSIGQGSNNFTIIQLANYIATLANGGNRWQPYLVDKVLSQEGEVVWQNQPTLLNRVTLDPKVLAETRRAMRAVAEPGGTVSFLFSNYPVPVACKTGTAETGRQGDNKDKDYHGLFVAFAPYDDPQIAFAGIMEYGYHGSESMGYVAKAVFDEYFGLNKPKEAAENPAQ